MYCRGCSFEEIPGSTKNLRFNASLAENSKSKIVTSGNRHSIILQITLPMHVCKMEYHFSIQCWTKLPGKSGLLASQNPSTNHIIGSAFTKVTPPSPLLLFSVEFGKLPFLGNCSGVANRIEFI